MSYNNFPLRTSYWVPVFVKYTDIADYLSEEDYEKYKGKYIDFEILISFDISGPDKSSGILSPVVQYTGNWALPAVGNYPPPIKTAIDDYLGTIDVEATYGNNALKEFMRPAY